MNRPGILEDMMEDARDTWLSAKFELRKHFRNSRLQMAVLLAAAVPLLFYLVPILNGTDFPETAAAFANNTLGFLTVLVLISAAVFAGDSISGEFDQRTGLLTFPTPQRKTSIFAGKYVAAYALVALVVSVFFGVLALETASVYGLSEIPTELAQSYGLALLYSASVMSVVFLFSAVIKRSMTSSLVGFFFFLMIMPIMAGVLMMVDIEPWFVPTYSAGLITNVLGFAPEVHGPEAVQGGGFEPDFLQGVAVMTAYAVVPFYAAMAVANRRKME